MHALRFAGLVRRCQVVVAVDIRSGGVYAVNVCRAGEGAARWWARFAARAHAAEARWEPNACGVLAACYCLCSCTVNAHTLCPPLACLQVLSLSLLGKGTGALEGRGFLAVGKPERQGFVVQPGQGGAGGFPGPDVMSWHLALLLMDMHLETPLLFRLTLLSGSAMPCLWSRAAGPHPMNNPHS